MLRRDAAKAPLAAPRPANLGGIYDSRAATATSGRATDLKLWMEVRLADAEELSDAANDSMTITRELGGWVAGSEIDTQGNEGRAELALRVPVTRVEDAIVRLGELGSVTGQQVETVDLQAVIDRRETRIETLELDRKADVPNCGVTLYEFDSTLGHRGKLALRFANFVAPLVEAGTPVTVASDVPAAPKS